MKYDIKTHEEGIDGCGTSLSGYLTMKRSALVELFGEPMSDGSGDGKVCCEWTIEATDEDGKAGVITIYDWKNYSRAAMKDDYSDWNVGGAGNGELSVLQEIINNCGIAGNHVRSAY